MGAIASKKKNQTDYTKLLDVLAISSGHLQGVTSHNIVTTYAYIADLDGDNPILITLYFINSSNYL